MISKNKILVVDDAKSVAGHIKGLLIPRYTAKAVYSGEEALEILPSFMPDLVLLDTVMTGIDGYEVCKRIRESGSFGFMKIIMISSRKTLEERLRGYEAGIDDHLGKPFEAEELLAKVKVFLRLKTVEDQLHELNAKLNDQVKLRTAQLLDAEKMAALGRHAAGIVHNLNNPLQAILGVTQVLAVKHPRSKDILSLETAAIQMRDIITTILTASRKQSHEHMVDIDLNQVVCEQVELFKSNQFFKHKIQVDMDLEPLPPFQGIYVHFSQCMGNLLKNGAEAMYASTTRRLSISSRQESHGITISISDTGTGISEEDHKKLFDPFFSTKPLVAEGDTPTGTGLGLAYCKEIIESYGGRILVDSKSDKGSRFTIRLPVNTKA
ncbi:sensor histidine kinase [Desulfospira joergensenii]|uniref:sensor histidine kinase n=1 Tax=Desulfospira joergensenii TaxID=53329 RepID=UPI0003B5486D|nr:hybrid sensor histidine kinase/response regulator [Desulfospira joergensenii]